MPNPESRILDPVYTERVRWRCRRGLLELDIVLERFIGQYYSGLDDAQQAVFDALLDMPDTELWDVIMGKTPVPQGNEYCAVLELIKAA
ncbi:MAG: succinate dehydrogenase assembly factor 2 [Gallionellaceae bacterium]|nr:succinate dehydrogenase assembly factor 2 [Gallionellaceae bacterium]